LGDIAVSRLRGSDWEPAATVRQISRDPMPVASLA